jgi:hypothetical protein
MHACDKKMFNGVSIESMDGLGGGEGADIGPPRRVDPKVTVGFTVLLYFLGR